MIRLTCPTCQKNLAVDDSKAGRTGQCPICKSTIRIPGAVEPAGAVAKRPPAPPPRPIAAEAERQALSPAPPIRRRAAEAVAKVQEVEEVEEVDDLEPIEEDDEPERLKRPKKKKKKKRASGGRMSDLYLALSVAGGLYLLLVFWALFARGGTVSLLIVGGILLACGQIWFIWLARQEDTIVYLMVRFVPFYSIYFFFTRIHETYKPFVTGSVGGLFLITGFIALLARGDLSRHYDEEDFAARGIPVFNRGFNNPGFNNPDFDRPQPLGLGHLAADLLARPDKAEAKAWLAGKRGRGVLFFDPGESMQHVQALYARGAKQVFVADIDVSEPENEDARFLVIVLPEQNRQALFEYARAALGIDEPDTGQKYLVLQ